MIKSNPKMCSSYGRLLLLVQNICSGLDRGDAGVAKAPPEFGGSLKGQSLISAYRSLAITASTSGFEKLSTALNLEKKLCRKSKYLQSTVEYFME